MAAEIDDQILQDLYTWIDEIPFSRPKKNITRDFSDGVMMAELVKYYFPQLVDLHNFAGAQAATQKKKNWHLLNWKVFKKLNFELSGEVVDSLANCKPGTVERVLLLIRTKIDRSLFEQKRQEESAKRANDQSSLNSPRQTKFFKFSDKTLSNDGVSNTSRNRYSNVPQSKSATAASQDAVPRVLYEERVQECLSREEMISVLQAKIRKMEHLLHLKDVRIEELSRQMENVRPPARGTGPKAAGRAGGGGGGGGGAGGGGGHAAPPMMNQQSQFPNQAPFSPAQLQQFQMQMGPNGQMPMMPPNGQMQMGPPNGQMQMGPNDQMQMGQNGQMQRGLPNGQMQMGPNGQMQRGPPNGQMPMGPPPGMQFGMPPGPGMGGKGQTNTNGNGYAGSQYNQYNQGFPSYMPLPPIPQPQDGESNPQTPQNDDTMYSRD